MALAPAASASTLLGGLTERGQQAVEAPGEERVRLARLAASQAMLSVDDGVRPSYDVPGDDRDRACPPDRCVDQVVAPQGGVRITSGETRIIVPPGYATSGKRYPVVYFFNGALSAYDQWTRSTIVTELSERNEAIYVFPTGGHDHLAGYFADWHDGSFQWETYHVERLIPWVDEHFRTLPGARGAVGASMGSLGALGYAARHPGLFQSVFTISGVVDTQQAAANGLPVELQQAAGLREAPFGSVWGNPVLDADNWAAHNPTALAPGLKGVHLLISSGTGFSGSAADAGTSDEIHSGTTEQNVWNDHRTFLTALALAGVDHEDHFTVGGVHTWAWFNDDLEWGVPKMVRELSRR